MTVKHWLRLCVGLCISCSSIQSRVFTVLSTFNYVYSSNAPSSDFPLRKNSFALRNAYPRQYTHLALRFLLKASQSTCFVSKKDTNIVLDLVTNINWTFCALLAFHVIEMGLKKFEKFFDIVLTSLVI